MNPLANLPLIVQSGSGWIEATAWVNVGGFVMPLTVRHVGRPVGAVTVGHEPGGTASLALLEEEGGAAAWARVHSD